MPRICSPKFVLAVLALLATLLLPACEGDITVRSERPIVYETINVIEEVEGTLVVEDFEVKEKKLDILFVVDYSCSMESEHILLADYMSTLYDGLVSGLYADVDWRVGLRSTDPSDPLAGYVDSANPNPEFALATLLVSSSLSVSGHEEGLASALHSLGQDVEFHRPEADALIIFVSDERDQSPWTFTTYDNIVATAKDPPYVVREGALIYRNEWEANNCLNGGGNSPGDGYIQIAEIVRSFCEPDSWDGILVEAYDDLEMDPLFHLEYTPSDTMDIIVYIDGEPSKDWSYEVLQNAVRPDDELAPGTEVIIAYSTLDLP